MEEGGTAVSSAAVIFFIPPLYRPPSPPPFPPFLFSVFAALAKMEWGGGGRHDSPFTLFAASLYEKSESWLSEAR